MTNYILIGTNLFIFAIGLVLGNSFTRKPMQKVLKDWKEKDWQIIQLKIEDKNTTTHVVTVKARNIKHAIEMMIIDREVKNVLSYKTFVIDNDTVISDWRDF